MTTLTARLGAEVMEAQISPEFFRRVLDRLFGMLENEPNIVNQHEIRNAIGKIYLLTSY